MNPESSRKLHLIFILISFIDLIVVALKYNAVWVSQWRVTTSVVVTKELGKKRKTYFANLISGRHGARSFLK